jgi:hypothetical protein
MCAVFAYVFLISQLHLDRKVSIVYTLHGVYIEICLLFCPIAWTQTTEVQSDYKYLLDDFFGIISQDLKVVKNENGGMSEWWQMLGTDLGPWRSTRFICRFKMLFACKKTVISVLAVY